MKPDNSGMYKYVTISYNPNNGRSWMIPGRIDDGDTIVKTEPTKYRIYFSEDFNKENGEPLNKSDGENWPIWKKGTKNNNDWLLDQHNYIHNTIDRKKDINTDYPVIIDRTSYNTFKDTDLTRYDGDIIQRHTQGYPLGLQIDQRIFTNFNHNLTNEPDNIVIQYVITNKSNTTLNDCHFGFLADFDIAAAENSQNGASNDRIDFYKGKSEQPDFVYCWTGTNRGELGKGFGYVGVSFIEVPTVDENKNLVKEEFTNKNLNGIHTFKNWHIAQDISEDYERYTALSSGIIDNGSANEGDVRALISSEPFNLRNNQSVRFAVVLVFANTAKGGEADGTIEDIDDLIQGMTSLFHDYHNLTGTGVVHHSKDSFFISPNPARDYIEVSGVVGEVKVFDVLGIEHPATAWHTSKEGNLKIDVSSLSPGVYFIRIGTYFTKFLKI